jgi:hypothetical protein
MNEYRDSDNRLLHVVLELGTPRGDGRYEATRTTDYLQVSALRFTDKVVAPHYHRQDIKQTISTQEAWILISGELWVQLYDLHEKRLDLPFKMTGPSVLVTLDEAAHEFHGTGLMVEVKSGNYVFNGRVDIDV